MTRKSTLRGRDGPSAEGTRRCRVLTNLALQIAEQLPGREREAVYRQLLQTLRDYIGEPDGASAAIARLLTGNRPRAA